MNVLKAENLAPNHPVRAAMAVRHWNEFTVIAIEPHDGNFDRTFSILAFEGAIHKLGRTGFATFDIQADEIGVDDPMYEDVTFFVQVA